ncbi:hypothetical protein HMPREF9162_1054 [Selenomonas sp. oral taxon 137 str. F0430]|nr:hypothetical protein HMPREF9162_1054 [Selenomonas sp. oral taxon 137 str. F0430]
MNLSRENCPTDSHRLTHERWGGDLQRRQSIDRIVPQVGA